jgi:phospholipase C
MSSKSWGKKTLFAARTGLAALALMQFSVAGPLLESAQAQEQGGSGTASPIKHVIIIVGENRSFDHIFATYKPAHGESVDNLLSKKIITEDGQPGPNYAQAHQNFADVTGTTTFQMAPTGKTLFSPLPAPLTGGPSNVCTDNGICTHQEAEDSENGLTNYYVNLLMTGGTGLPSHVPDSRISGVLATPPYTTLLPGPFQLTGPNFPYDSYAASPVHRFYQMWQQLDCSVANVTKTNSSGCLADLFAYTEVTQGAGQNGQPQPSNFSINYSPTAKTTGEGSTSMGFYNMAEGDAKYTKFLADHYAISDNYHQPAKGGTGLDSLYLGFADAVWFQDQNGNLVPPHNQMTWAGGPVDEIENPVSQTGTNNYWIEDGYGGFGNTATSTGVYGGGSYSNCSDATQPGVGPILSYLAALPTPINPNCDAGHYYLLNNYNPGYFGDGTNAYTNTNPNNTPFTIPPTSQHSIADVLLAANVSWKYYGDQWNQYVGLNGFAPDPYQLNYGTVGKNSDQYCNICNPFQYQTQIMTNDAVRTAHLVDTTDLYADIASGNLPSVSYVKPSGWVDGHPASSKWGLFEGFVEKIVTAVKANPKLWAETAIFVTVDEGGGYYDSGFVQNLDFFGDGTRIPLIAVSPFTKPGHIAHNYSDHASIVKFIERNWKLGTISNRSRDNFPNPKAEWNNPYVPTNSPAISDLFELFDFSAFQQP